MVVVPSKMGRLNQRALLDRLQMMGTASRASLAKSIGLSQPTAGKIGDQLIAMQVGAGGVDPGRTAGRPGRPGRMIRLNRTPVRFLAIQLDVSETSLAPLPLGVSGEDEWMMQVPTGESMKGWQKQLEKASKKLKQREFWGVLV